MSGYAIGAGKAFVSLNAATSGNGKVFGAAGFSAVSCQIQGISGGTVQIQGSNDPAGAGWDLLEAAITADDIFQVEMGANYLRAAITAAGGTITATFVGV